MYLYKICVHLEPHSVRELECVEVPRPRGHAPRHQLLGQLRGGEAALRHAEGRGAAVEVSWRGHAVHRQPGHRGRQRQEQPRDLGLVRGDGSVASLQPGAETRSLGHEAGPRPQRGEVLHGGLHPGHGLETLCA